MERQHGGLAVICRTNVIILAANIYKAGVDYFGSDEESFAQIMQKYLSA